MLRLKCRPRRLMDPSLVIMLLTLGLLAALLVTMGAYLEVIFLVVLPGRRGRIGLLQLLLPRQPARLRFVPY